MNNIILTVYFTTKKDPQREVFWRPDDYSIIKDWYESIIKLGLTGIIFHDSLSDGFINKYQNDNVQFIRWMPGEMSTNDERFFCFFEYLQTNYYDHVLLTDIDDLFVRDPFEFMTGNYDIYAGGDKATLRTNYFARIGREPFPMDRTRILANCDAIGGTHENIMKLLNSMVWLFKQYRDKFNINMAVFNHCLYSGFERIHVGYPLTSGFGRNETTGNHFIKHK